MTKNKKLLGPDKIKIFAIFITFISLFLLVESCKKTAERNEPKTKKVSVLSAPLTKKTVSENLSIAGTVKANNDVKVVSETQGKVINIHMSLGEYVEKGKIIAEIDNVLKEASFLSAKTNYEKAKKDYERYQNLFKGNFVSEAEVENSKNNLALAESQFITAQRELNNTKIIAPISGIIANKNIGAGSYVSNGMEIANIVDISKLKIIVNVGERYILKIKKGDTVSMTMDLYPDYSIEGIVNGKSPKGTDSITFPVEIIILNNKNKPISDGMSIKVNFSFGKKDIKIIPRSALIGSSQDPKVFILEGNTAKIKSIAIGNEYDTDIEVLSGLMDDDKIVVSGQNNLSDNSEVEVQN
jgi:RND family efflux transporter MFP subunit